MDIETMFHLKRFTNFNAITSFLFMLYCPFGIFLLVSRILMSFQYLLVLAILPKQWLVRRLLMRVYYFFMGVIVTSSCSKYKEDGAQILISNHVSYLDSIAIEVIQPTVRATHQSKLPSLFAWLMGFQDFLPSWKSKVKDLIESNGVTFSCYPEEVTTNGTTGLMKFSDWPFKLTQGVVQPVVVLANRPSFIPVHVSYIHSTFWSDLFWTLYIPFTQFHISYLPLRKVPEHEDNLEEFVEKLQQEMAYVLAVKTTNFKAQDKKDFVKRLRHEEKQRLLRTKKKDSPIKRSMTPSEELMIKQVKSVLPQVPLNVIASNLIKTRNVDTTIANILDGSVEYTPLNESEQASEKQSKVDEVSVFNGNTTERHLTFQEKKRKLIEEARRKYLELHPGYR